jgi:hypothetical protein
MIAVTRIPTHRNDGSEVSDRELRSILRKVRVAFGAYSLEGPCDGAWTADDGKVYEERSRKLEVVVPKKKLRAIRTLFKEIGTQLGQRAIYFEVREGGEIIDLE